MDSDKIREHMDELRQALTLLVRTHPDCRTNEFKLATVRTFLQGACVVFASLTGMPYEERWLTAAAERMLDMLMEVHPELVSCN